MGENVLLQARKRALHYLKFRDRTVAEMETYLRKRGFPSDVVENVIAWLMDIGYLDDTRFAESYIESRLRSKPMGKARLRCELRQKGLDSSLTEEQLSGITALDELRLARELVKKRVVKMGGEPADVYRRLQSLLLRRGFPYETVRQVLEEELGNLLT